MKVKRTEYKLVEVVGYEEEVRETLKEAIARFSAEYEAPYTDVTVSIDFDSKKAAVIKKADKKGVYMVGDVLLKAEIVCNGESFGESEYSKLSNILLEVIKEH